MPTDIYRDLLSTMADICSDAMERGMPIGEVTTIEEVALTAVTWRQVINRREDSYPWTFQEISGFIHSDRSTVYCDEFRIFTLKNWTPHRFAVQRKSKKRHREAQPRKPALPPTRFEREWVI